MLTTHGAFGALSREGRWGRIGAQVWGRADLGGMEVGSGAEILCKCGKIFTLPSGSRRSTVLLSLPSGGSLECHVGTGTLPELNTKQDAAFRTAASLAQTPG